MSYFYTSYSLIYLVSQCVISVGEVLELWSFVINQNIFRLLQQQMCVVLPVMRYIRRLSVQAFKTVCVFALPLFHFLFSCTSTSNWDLQKLLSSLQGENQYISKGRKKFWWRKHRLPIVESSETCSWKWSYWMSEHKYWCSGSWYISHIAANMTSTKTDKLLYLF